MPASWSSVSRWLSTLGDMESQRSCNILKPSVSVRNSHSMRSVQRRPNRSNNAIIGRPLCEPLTGLPGFGVAILPLPSCASISEVLYLICYEFRSNPNIARFCTGRKAVATPLGTYAETEFWPWTEAASDRFPHKFQGVSLLASPGMCESRTVIRMQERDFMCYDGQ